MCREVAGREASPRPCTSVFAPISFQRGWFPARNSTSRGSRSSFGGFCSGARGAVAAGRRRTGAGFRPARLSGQPGIAGRPRRRDAHPHRHRGPGAAPLDRARRSGLAGLVEASFAALSAVPQRDPNDPIKHNEVWIARHRIFHRAPVNACGSHWLLGFRDVLHEQSERYRRFRSARPENPATSPPNTPRWSMPCSGAMPKPPWRR